SKAILAGRWITRPLCAATGLLEGDLCACLFQLSLSCLSVLLGSALEQSLRSSLNELLSLLQPQAGDDLADDHNDADLLSACVLQVDVELVLLLSSSAALSATSSCNSSNRSSSGHVEGLLEQLDELRELDQGHLLEGIQQLFVGELSHNRHPFVLCRLGYRP